MRVWVEDVRVFPQEPVRRSRPEGAGNTPQQFTQVTQLNQREEESAIEGDRSEGTKGVTVG